MHIAILSYVTLQLKKENKTVVHIDIWWSGPLNGEEWRGVTRSAGRFASIWQETQQWATKLGPLSDQRKWKQIIDPEVAELALSCLDMNPKRTPTMQQVVETLETAAETA